MAWKDYAILVVSSLRARKLRAGLTLTGIVIGITAVVSLLSLGLGLEESITGQFERLGTNRLTIAPGGEFLGPGTADLVSPILDDDDLAVIRRARGIEEAHGVLTANQPIEFDDTLTFAAVFAFETDAQARAFIEDIGLFDIEDGRELKSTDQFKAVIGNTLAKDGLSQDKEVLLGDKLIISGIEFEVVGIQKLIGTGIHDTIIRMPQDTFRDIIDEPDKFSMIFATTQTGFTPEAVAEEVKQDLRNHRNVKEDEEDFNVQTASQTIGQLNTILLAVQIVIIGIATISLLVGSIGIMNTMYTAVLERTKEIGIMKSIGARNSHVVFLFILEAGMLGIAGGAIGLGIGLAIAKLGESLAINFGASFFKAHTSLTLMIGTIIFSGVLGTASGALPARQAARLKPVEALRSYK